MIAQDIGRNEFDNGYLSDVPAPSETSSRGEGMKPASPSFLVHPSEMERVFKQKYDFLREAYEQRIKQLATAIEGGMANFLTDEIVSSMSEHGITAAYMHQHLAEVFDDHLKNDRERYIHQSLSKIATLEVDIKASNDLNAVNRTKIQKMNAEIDRLNRELLVIEPMRKAQASVAEKCRNLEQQFAADREELLKQNEYLQEHNTKTTQQLTEALEMNEHLEKECEAFRKETMTKTMEVSRLEQTIDQTSQHLEILAREEAQDKDMIPQLQAQIIALSKRMEGYTKENYELKYRVRQYGEDYARTTAENERLLQEQETYKTKTSLLMSQVEEIIAQETSESNATISAIHKKMKDLRGKLALDLQRETRISAALQEEVTELKGQKELWKTELRQSAEEVTRVKQKLEFEEQRVSMLQKQQAELALEAAEAKSAASEANTRMILAEKRLDAMEKLKKEEMRIVEANAYLSAQKNVEAHHDHLEAREMAYKLKQANDRDLLKNQLRHSYSGGEVAQFHDLQSPGNIFERIGSMTTNQDIVNESILAGKEFQHQHELSRLQHELEGEASHSIRLLQDKLEESMQNIDKLKRIVQDQRSANVSLETRMLNEQQIRTQLETELHDVRQQMLAGENTIARLSINKSQEMNPSYQQHQQPPLSQSQSQSQSQGPNSNRRDNTLLQSRDHNANGRWNRNSDRDGHNEYGHDHIEHQHDHGQQRYDDNEPDCAPSPSLFSHSVNMSKKSNRYGSDHNNGHGNEMYNSYGDENIENHASVNYNDSNRPNMDHASVNAINNANAEIQRLRAQVEELEVANSSLQDMLSKMELDRSHEQQNDSMALDEMRGKFESLMSNYGQGENALRLCQEQHSAELAQKDQTISMLQQNLRHLSDIGGEQTEESRHLAAEFKSVHAKWMHSRQVMLSMESLYHDHIRGLRTALGQVKNTVQNMQSQFALEKDRVCREMQQSFSTCLAAIERKHAEELKRVRTLLVAGHDASEKQLEESFNQALMEKNVSHENEMAQTKSDLVGKISELSMIGSGDRVDDNMSALSVDTSMTVPRLDSAKVDSAEVALSTHLKLIIKGLMEALVSSDLVPGSVNSELQLIMSPDKGASSGIINKKIGVSASVCVLIRKHLSEFLNASSTISNQLEMTKRDLKNESERRIFNENALNELQRAVGGSSGNMLASPMFASPGGSSKTEEALMNELRLLEAKSQIKVLQERMEEVQLSYKAEMRRLEVAASAREATLKRTLEAKYSSILSSDKQLVSELESQLTNEQNKRKQLQLRLVEDEKALRLIIDELEQRNHELQTRAEKAELLVSKLKINNSSFGISK